MNGAFYIGATGLDIQQRALDVVAHNIANINTPAFKRSAVRFSELVAPVRGDAGDLTSQDRAATLDGVTTNGSSRIWTPGDLKQTGGALDLAIDGSGFLELLGPAGHTLLWRGGTLKVNGDGYLSAADGTPLRAMISVPQGARDLVIDRNGLISATLEEGTQQLGQLDLMMVKDPDGLTEAGDGYYELNDAAGVFTVAAGDEGGGTFVQGAIEQANVALSDEMVTLLLLQRAYAANAQMVQAGDQLMAIANSLRR